MTEAALQDCVIDAARTLGYRATHFRAAQTMGSWRTPIQGDKGWPDVVICGHGKLWIIELKSARGKTTVEQDDWLAELQAAGVEAFVLFPYGLDMFLEILAKEARK